MSTATPGSATGAALGAPSISRLRATVDRLAAADCTGRRVGTPGNRRAAAWLIEQLRTIGATVTTSQFNVDGVLRELCRTPELVWRHHGSTRRLRHRRDFAEHLISPDLAAPRTSSLVTTATSAWRDRWILAPDLDRDILDRARRQDATGLLIPRDTDAAGWMPKMIAGPPVGRLPVLSVHGHLHDQMRADLGRVTASAPLRTVSVTGTNLHGVFASGTSPRVLLTAHYDGVGDDPDQRLPAAADNASGVAVVLEAARRLAPSLAAHTGLAVAFVDAEEIGAHGSAHHAQSLAPDTFVINVDGAGRLGEAAAIEAGGPARPLLTALDQAGRATGVTLRAGPMASDNRRYAAAGLPAIGIGMGIPGFQTPAETPDRVDSDTLHAATELIIHTVRQLTIDDAT